MPAATLDTHIKKTPRVWQELQNLPEVTYPPEVVERIEREVAIAKAQLASGELVPMTVAEYAAKRGLKIG